MEGERRVKLNIAAYDPELNIQPEGQDGGTY